MAATPHLRSLLPLLVPFAVAFVATLLLTPLARRVALRLDVVAVPKNDRWNRRTVPLLGGASIAVSVWIAAAVMGLFGRETLPLLLAGSAMFVVGIVDDFVQLKPSTKLTAQIGAACLVLVMGTTLQWTQSEVINALITIVWIAAVTNAVNLLDNMDGLCAGVVAIAALGFATSGDPSSAARGYAAAVAGASAAFLFFNFNPASIFLGDVGSMFLGSTLAVLSTVEQESSGGLVSAVGVPALLLLLPIFDSIFVTLSRKLSARAASIGGRDHTSHRLVALGFSERNAVLLCYGLAAAGTLAAVALQLTRAPETPLMLGVLVLALLFLGIQLARVRVYGGGEDLVVLRNRAYTPLLLDITYKRRVFEVLLDLGLVSFSYYAAYVVRFDHEFWDNYALLVASLPIVIAVQLVSFFIVGVYRPVWRYFSTSDVATYLRGILLGTVGSVLALLYLYRFYGYSRGVFIIYALMLGVLMIGSRASFRLLADVASRHGAGEDRTIICGAGDRGALVVRELRNNPRHLFRPVAFLDDAPAKLHRRVMGLPVVGRLDDAEAAFRRYKPSVLIVSTSKIPRDRMARLQRACAASGVRMLQLDFAIREVPLDSPAAKRQA
jgi:UDP-GlcNAc:undecaprenyl-phosphate GlcNAc-1-phosphate transferase